tara:strand:- start:1105 stop:3018 length:1914 start_codon:yes stop_codon:yes gene_type:complete
MNIEKINQGDQLSQSADLVNDNIDKLKMLFPEIVTEGKIDFNVLQEVLGENLEEAEEYYRFTWAGKSQSRREAHKPSTGTLRPAKEESLDWDTTENMYIEGDNLEVLKLLQKSYAGKIKMIYIDPPYNTGKDFVYKDNYKDNLKNYQEVTGQIDSEGNKTSTNSDSDGRYHSNWLNMMYPRLSLARNLLKDDGVIFMSIDDNEVENLVKLGNEIFGEENFIDIFSWIKSETPANLSFKTKKCVEYVVSFQKVKDNQKFIGLKRDSSSSNGLMNKTNPINKLVFPVNLVDTGLVDGIYKKGEYGTDSYQILLHENTTVKNGLFIEPVILSGNFKWTQVKLNNEIERGTKISIRTNSFSPAYEKLEYEPEVPWNLISRKFNVDTNENEGKRLKLLFDNHKVFDYPKPITLLNYIFNFSLKNDEILLDFFSGSSSSAHSILDLNHKNNSRLKFIQVQLPEQTDKKSDAFKLGYNSISEIGKERIRRVVQKIKEDHPEKSKNMDLGFKVFKLDSSNIKSWDGNPENLNESLFDAVGNIKTDRTEEDVLYEILLKYGLDLTLPIEERIIEDKKVFNVGLGSLFICLADDITAKVAEGIGQWKEACSPEICRVIFKDNGFTDVEKTNSVQTLKRYGINEIRSI